MQQLPQLNTGTNDISNTLLNLAKFKDIKESNDLQNENTKKRNALLDIKLSPEVQERENAVAKLALKKGEIDLETAKAINRKRAFDYAVDGLNWVDAAVEAGDETAYPIFVKSMLDKGFDVNLFPTEDTFYDTKPDLNGEDGKTKKVLNKDRFSRWVKRASITAKDMYTGKKVNMKTVYGPNGKTKSVWITEGEVYDPEKEIGPGWSFAESEKAPGIEKVRKGSGKDTKEVGLVWNKEKKKYEEISSGSAFKPDTSSDKVAGENKLKEVMQNSNGDTVFVMTDGSVKLSGKDGKTRNATEEETRGLKELEKPLTPIEQFVAQSLGINANALPEKKLEPAKELSAAELAKYRKAYPNRTDAQIKAAYNKKMQKKRSD